MGFGKIRMGLEIWAWGRDIAEIKDDFSTMLRIHLGGSNSTNMHGVFYVSLEHDPVKLRKISTQIPRANRMLVIFEPKSVNPSQHTRRIRNKYGSIVIISESHRMSESDILWDYGVLPTPEIVEKTISRNGARTGNREFEIGLINENKFSTNIDEAYTLRQRLIEKLAKSEHQVAVAGANWEKGFIWYTAKQAFAALIQLRGGHVPRISKIRFPFSRADRRRIAFLGRVDTQVGFLSRCSYSLVIENEATYVTEKLFNALVAGSLPLYIGPDLRKYGIPERVATNIDKPYIKSIDAALRTSVADQNRWEQNIYEWLRLPVTQERWGLEPSVKRLVEIIKLFVSSQ
jgi:hypothetical protein